MVETGRFCDVVDNSKKEFKASKDQVNLKRNLSTEVFCQIDIHKIYKNYFNKCHISKNILFQYKKDPKPIELKKVYFQNKECDKEEIQTLDEGSTFITRLRIKEGFDFCKNVKFANINLSALLFFHESPNPPLETWIPLNVTTKPSEVP